MDRESVLCGRTVLLGVSGGIAAYKAVELVRLLQKQDAHVRVVMTQAATKFVGPLTFEAVSGEPVYHDMWKPVDEGSIQHIAWAKEADCVVIAPATANTIAKLAHGIADNALSTLMLAINCPMLLCPSMNAAMLAHPATHANLRTLAERPGVHIMASGEGYLACGDLGSGRLPEPPDILDRVAWLLTEKDFAGLRVLVTAGPTQEKIDPVRFVSNPSSGRMGFAVARAAEHRGADVTLITGPVSLPDPLNVRVLRVESAEQMARAVFDHFPQSDVVVKSAAVSDYRPVEVCGQKIKGSRSQLSLTLAPNPDILAQLGRDKKDRVLVGFAAETEKLCEHACEKLEKKNLDMIVANLIGAPGSGFAAATNQATLFLRGGREEKLALMSKDELAHVILDRVLTFLPEEKAAGRTE
ncbi:MAG: bifunctional phosphopantothenoylcysteine decarboxylase/phosphopantothenate--cysteine ligase CoaBC [Thermodesulfobacteriota bacterium]